MNRVEIFALGVAWGAFIGWHLARSWPRKSDQAPRREEGSEYDRGYLAGAREAMTVDRDSG